MKFHFIFGLIFACLGLVFSAIGVGLIWSQYHRCTTFVPVEALIESKTIEKHVSHGQRGRTSVTYKPVIRYRYKVNGIGYVSDKYGPISYKTSNYESVKVIVNNFKIGQTVTAYRNPKDPNDAFLVKKYFFMPYLFAMFGMPFFTIGVLFVFFGFKRIIPAKFVGAGWYKFFPVRSVSDKFKSAGFITIIWHALGLGVLGHYFMYVSRPYSMISYIVGGIYEFLGLIPAGFCVYYWILSKRTAEPVLLADRDKFTRGDKIKLRIEQQFKTDLLVEELLLTLVCVRYSKVRRANKTEYKIERFYENTISLLKNRQIRQAQPLIANAEIDVPSDKPPTSPKGFKQYPRYEWFLEVLTRIEKSPDSKLAFPVFVQ